MTDAWSLLVTAGAWSLTYAVHSTVVLGSLWLLTRWGLPRNPATVATLWKVGVVAALVTATVRTFPAGGTVPGAPQVHDAPRALVVEGIARALPGEAPLAERQIRSESRFTCEELRRREPEIAALAPGLWGSPIEGRELGSRLRDHCRRGGTEILLAGWGAAWMSLALVLSVGSLAAFRRFRRGLAGDREPPSPELVALLGRLVARAGSLGDAVVTVSRLPGSPLALGRREIRIPERALRELEPPELEAVLAHELAHLERRDPTWLTGLGWISRILFFQPLNALALRRFRECAEMACDDRAVHLTGHALPLARSLGTVGSWMVAGSAGLAGIAGEGPAPLVARVQRILAGPGARGRGPASVLVAFAFLPFVLLPGVRLPTAPEAAFHLVVERRAELLGPAGPASGDPVTAVAGPGPAADQRRFLTVEVRDSEPSGNPRTSR